MWYTACQMWIGFRNIRTNTDSFRTTALLPLIILKLNTLKVFSIWSLVTTFATRKKIKEKRKDPQIRKSLFLKYFLRILILDLTQFFWFEAIQFQNIFKFSWKLNLKPLLLQHFIFKAVGPFSTYPTPWKWLRKAN